MTRTITLALAAGLSFLAASASADIITFEGVAPPGGEVNVSPGTPYSEGGYTFTPSNGNAAVFDPAFGVSFPGDSTAFFGFAGGNVITMTGPASFDLDSLLIGPNSIGAGEINATLDADVFGGGTLSTTLPDLTDATLITLDWTNLTDVTISATSDAAIDNLTVNADVAAVPEPPAAILLFTGMAGIGFLGRRKFAAGW